MGDIVCPVRVDLMRSAADFGARSLSCYLEGKRAFIDVSGLGKRVAIIYFFGSRTRRREIELENDDQTVSSGPTLIAQDLISSL